MDENLAADYITRLKGFFRVINKREQLTANVTVSWQILWIVYLTTEGLKREDGQVVPLSKVLP